MLHLLHDYCLDWGLTVNLEKTAVMVFNKSGRLLKESTSYTYGDVKVSSVREYCYLGITFTLNGSLNIAQQKLKQKGLRAYFSLKNMIDIRPLKRSVVFKLFDSLILPIASYGCQVWFPETWLVKNLTENTLAKQLQNIAKDPVERLHLSFLKWSLGVSKNTSNAAVWGDSGRFPLLVVMSKQVLNYFERLKNMSTNQSNSIVKCAFNEQKALNMTWYRRINSLQEILQSHSTFRLNYPSQLRARLMEDFKQSWDSERHCNRKLAFYNSIKTSFGPEKYIDVQLKHKELKRTAQFRMSSHKYNIETGRYGSKYGNILNRICGCCSTEDQDTLEFLRECPFFEPIVEDETHILNHCPRYSEERAKLKEVTRQLINSTSGIAQIFSDKALIKDLAIYIQRCHSIRFPEEMPEENAKEKT